MEKACTLIFLESSTGRPAEFSGGAAHLGRRSVLLNRWRRGAGVGVGGWRLHIVVAEAAEKRAEDAPAPLLL